MAMWNRLLLLIVCFSLVPGQDYTVMGSITDFYTGEPVESAIISCWTSPDSVLLATDTTDSGGNYEYSFSVVSIDSRQLPDKFGLLPNYPNPFNPSTVIPFSITDGGEYTLRSFNILGQLLDHFEFTAGPGYYNVRYDGANGTAGLQFIELQGKGQRSVQKIILLEGGGSQGFMAMSGNSGQTTLLKAAENQPVIIRVHQEGYEEFEEHSDLTEGTSVMNYEISANTYTPELSLVVLVDSLTEDSFAPLTVATIDLFDPDQQTDFLADFQYSNHELGTLGIHAPTASINLYQLTPNAFGTFEYQLTIEDDDGNTVTVQSELIIQPVNDLPGMHYNIIHNSIGEDTTGFPITLIDQLEFLDVDAGETVDSVAFRWTSSDSVYLSWDSTSVWVDSLRTEWNGSMGLMFDLYQDGNVAATDTIWSEVRAKPDVTLRIRDLTRAGMPIMDWIESTFEIGDSVFQAVGQITKQLEPGISYEIFAYNDSTGIYYSSIDTLYDPFIAIRTLEMEWLIEENLEQRTIRTTDGQNYWGDTTSAMTFTESDIQLELYKLGYTEHSEFAKIYVITNTWNPHGLDKPNTLTPEVWIDTTFADYALPDSQSIANARFVIEELVPELTSEFGFAPIWMGFGTPPEPDSEGITFYTIKYDNTVSPPGYGIPYVNSNNVIYRSVTLLSAQNTNNILYTALEVIQPGLGMVGDPGPDNDIVDDVLLYVDDQGVPYFNKLFYTTMRVMFVFDRGSNI
jgi:hypothetical protein